MQDFEQLIVPTTGEAPSAVPILLTEEELRMVGGGSIPDTGLYALAHTSG
ncbi:MAG: hypothetical protein ABI702_19745 [Burkholderiales bacterium]